MLATYILFILVEGILAHLIARIPLIEPDVLSIHLLPFHLLCLQGASKHPGQGRRRLVGAAAGVASSGGRDATECCYAFIYYYLDG